MQIVTATGAIIPLMGKFKPKIEDICHSLSQINRYAGHTSEPYSVAQHSVLVSKIVPPHLAFQALMHDAHEAYTTDLPSPMKEVLNFIHDDWSIFEERFSTVVRTHFGLPKSLSREVKEADRKIMSYEIGSLFPDKAIESFIRLGFLPDYNMMIVPLSHLKAYNLFLDRFFELTNG